MGWTLQQQNAARHGDGHRVSPIVRAELLQNIFQVHSDGFAGDGKLRRYLLRAVPPRDQSENLDLTRGKRLAGAAPGESRAPAPKRPLPSTDIHERRRPARGARPYNPERR